jgi:hypothetical protein
MASKEPPKRKRQRKPSATKVDVAQVLEDYDGHRADRIYEPPYGDPIISVRVPIDVKLGLGEAHWRYRVFQSDIVRIGIQRELTRMGILDDKGKVIPREKVTD